MNSIELQQRPQDVPHVPEQLLIAAETTQPAHDVLADKAQVHNDRKILEKMDAVERKLDAEAKIDTIHDETETPEVEAEPIAVSDEETEYEDKPETTDENRLKPRARTRLGRKLQAAKEKALAYGNVHYLSGLDKTGKAAAKAGKKLNELAQDHELGTKVGVGLVGVAGVALYVAGKLSGNSEGAYGVAQMMDTSVPQGGASHDTVGQAVHDVVANHSDSATGQSYDIQQAAYGKNMPPVVPDPNTNTGANANVAPLQFDEVKKGEGFNGYLKEAGMLSPEERAAALQNSDLMKEMVDNKDAYARGKSFGLSHSGALKPESTQALEAFHQDWMTKNPNGVPIAEVTGLDVSAKANEVVVSNGMGRVNVELPDGFKSNVDKNGVLHVVTPDNKDISVTLPKDAIDPKTGQLTPQGEAAIKDALKANNLDVKVTPRKNEVKLLAGQLIENADKTKPELMNIEYKTGPQSNDLHIRKAANGVTIDASKTGLNVLDDKGVATTTKASHIALTDANGKTIFLAAGEDGKVFVANDSPIGKMLAEGRHVDVRAGVLDEANNKFMSHATAVAKGADIELGPNYELVAASTDAESLAGVDTTITIEPAQGGGTNPGSGNTGGSTGGNGGTGAGQGGAGSTGSTSTTTSPPAPTTTNTPPPTTTTTSTTASAAPTTTQSPTPTGSSTTRPEPTMHEVFPTTTSKAAVPTTTSSKSLIGDLLPTTEAPSPTTPEVTPTSSATPTSAAAAVPSESAPASSAISPEELLKVQKQVDEYVDNVENSSWASVSPWVPITTAAGAVAAGGVALYLPRKLEAIRVDENDRRIQSYLIGGQAEPLSRLPADDRPYDASKPEDVENAQKLVRDFSWEVGNSSRNGDTFSRTLGLSEEYSDEKVVAAANQLRENYKSELADSLVALADGNVDKDTLINYVNARLTSPMAIAQIVSTNKPDQILVNLMSLLGLDDMAIDSEHDWMVGGYNTMLKAFGFTPEELSYQPDGSGGFTLRSENLSSALRHLAQFTRKVYPQQVSPVAQPRPLQAPLTPSGSNWSNPPQASQGQVPSTPPRPQPRPVADDDDEN